MRHFLCALVLASCFSDHRVGDESHDGGSSNGGAYSWTVRAPLPVPRTDLGVVALGGKVYAIGGSAGSTVARVDEYDPMVDAWTQKADLHAARRSFSAGVIDGKIYVSAGMSYGDPNAITYVTSTEVYDAAADTWTLRAPCPLPPAPNADWGNQFIGGTSANGLLYVIVFSLGPSGGATTLEYDPTSDMWTTRAPIPLFFPQAGSYRATELNHLLYVYSSDTNGGTVASYNPSNGLWIIQGGLAGISNPAFVAANGKLLALGGIASAYPDPTIVTDATHIYDLISGQWTPDVALHQKRELAGAAELGGHVFVVGGQDDLSLVAAPLATVEEGIPR